MVGNQCEIHWLFLQRLKSERHPVKSGVNEGQEKSSSTMKN